MKISRIDTDAEGETHFDEIEEPEIEFRSNAKYTRAIDAYGVMFRTTEPLGDNPPLGEWHTAPQRQYVMFLKGDTEIEVSDGEKRRFKSGDTFLVEDTSGKGHRNLRFHKEPELWAFARSFGKG